MLDRKECEVGMSVSYLPHPMSESPEFGIIVKLCEKWAMVKYNGDYLSKATYYSDLNRVIKKGNND